MYFTQLRHKLNQKLPFPEQAKDEHRRPRLRHAAIPAVMFEVTGRLFPSQAGRLPDYARYALKNRLYPGLRHEPGAETLGLLFKGVDERSLRLLDESGLLA